MKAFTVIGAVKGTIMIITYIARSVEPLLKFLKDANDIKFSMEEIFDARHVKQIRNGKTCCHFASSSTRHLENV